MHSTKKPKTRIRLLSLLLILPGLASLPASAIDTDIFTAGTNAAAPNVLIVLDNTTNWSRNDEKFTDGNGNSMTQGDAELAAIKQITAGLPGYINVGLLEFVSDSGGYVRYAISPMGSSQPSGPANKTSFGNLLSSISVTSPSEKVSTGQPYGNLMYDAYNYFAGVAPFAASSNVQSNADSKGYVTNYTQFKSPLSSADSCAHNYIIFIGNPQSSGPTADLNANTLALKNLGGDVNQLKLMQFSSTPVYGPTGTYQPDTNPWNADEWARFLYQKGVPVSVPNSTTPAYFSVSTFTVDVYNAKPNTSQSSLLTGMAKNGGGRYFATTDEKQIVAALQSIFGEIQATNSAFASAALPISATNRTVNRNEVYIGMFRPDQQSFPRWFGNLKRYQFGIISGTTELVDANGNPAVSTTSGFVAPCATSFWTTDLGNYWAGVDSSTGTVSPRVFFTTATTAGTAWATQGDDTLLAKGLCQNTPLPPPYSDQPDGPIVEKGGAAEQVRSATSRIVKTLSGTSVVDFNSTNVTTLSSNATVNASIVNFIRGQDVTGEINGLVSTSNRPSIHGDVIHSRPLAVDFGGTTGVKVYYGANDGVYRAVNATTGAEEWSFVAPQSFPYLQRLLDNSPVVQTPSPTPPNATAATGTMKDFFFDGSTGLYQNSDSSKVWIYPSMRRGGKMLYAFNVSPGAPPASVKWKAGCDSSGCTDSKLSNIGQTWSTPNVAFLAGYSTSVPIVVMGGGYDTCEDADSNPSASGFCTSPKGAGVYVFDGDTGAVIASFTTDRSVAGDVTFVDVNLDGNPDLAYVADTGGNIYRIKFSDPANGFTALSSINWTITKVAYTRSASRKFLFAPAALAYKNQVYLALGSGDREHPTAASYPFTMPVTNRFYVYLDDPLRTTATDLDGANMYNHSDTTVDVCNYEQVLPGGAKYGWYMDLGQFGKGEQTVTSALINLGRVTFSTNRPFGSTTASCSSPLGEARGYWLNLLNGSGAIDSSGNQATCGVTRSSTFVGGGLPPSPVTGTVTINGIPQTVVIGAVQADGSVSSPIGGQKAVPPIKPIRRRVYWRTSSDTH